MEITFDDKHTYFNLKPVSCEWKFISDGTWFDKDTICILEEDGDCREAGGLFLGMRTSENEGSEGRPLGTKYMDGELCSWDEFPIVLDKNDNII